MSIQKRFRKTRYLFFISSFGVFTISKSDIRSVRQINSRKINLLKKLPPVGLELATATII